MSEIGDRIEEVRRRIAAARERSDRAAAAVRLVAVTKTVPAARVSEAAEAGLTEFGENYVQELEEKRAAAGDATWHFLGRLQSNKVARVRGAADWVQTLEPGRGGRKLGAADGRPLPCLVQVDYAGGRVGVRPEAAEAFVAQSDRWPGTQVRGLMTVPPLGSSPGPYFRRLRELRDRLRERFPDVVELSMGMSADYEEAVEEGATMVRVGTAIFGPRP